MRRSFQCPQSGLVHRRRSELRHPNYTPCHFEPWTWQILQRSSGLGRRALVSEIFPRVDSGPRLHQRSPMGGNPNAASRVSVIIRSETPKHCVMGKFKLILIYRASSITPIKQEKKDDQGARQFLTIRGTVHICTHQSRQSCSKEVSSSKRARGFIRQYLSSK